MVKGGVASKRAQYSHDLFTKEALEFVDRNREKPFFLYLAYTMPHANDERGGQGGQRHGSAERRPLFREAVAADGEELCGDGHAAGRRRGPTAEALKELGLDENTIVFFSSDNGPHKEGGYDPKYFDSAGPLRGFKRDLTEGGIREPIIARWPGKIKAGVATDQVGAFWDFLPTAADLAGAKTPAGLDGISLVPTLLGDGQAGATRVPLLGVSRTRPATGGADGRLEGIALEAGRPVAAIRS